MSIITWIILGLIAGFVGAKLVNREGQGFWLDIALGIVGALVGGFLFALFGASGVMNKQIAAELGVSEITVKVIRPAVTKIQ